MAFQSAGNGIELVLQFTCRNRIALMSDLLGAAALGLHNPPLLTGDDPSAGDQPDAKPDFDLSSRALIELAASMSSRGVLPSRGRTARWMRENLWGVVIPDEVVDRLDKAKDPKTEGIQICAEQIQEISGIRGIAGVHFIAPTNTASIPEVLAAAKIERRRL